MMDTWPDVWMLNAPKLIDSATAVHSDRILLHDGGIFCFFSTKELNITDGDGKELKVTHYGVHNNFHIHCTSVESTDTILSFYTNGSFLQSAHCVQQVEKAFGSATEIAHNPLPDVHSRSRLRFISLKSVGSRFQQPQLYNRIIERASPFSESIVLDTRRVYWFAANEPIEVISNNAKRFSVAHIEFSGHYLCKITSGPVRGVLWFCFADGHMERVIFDSNNRQVWPANNEMMIVKDEMLLPPGHIPFRNITVLDQKIGEGTFGIIYLAKLNDQKFAVKKFKSLDGVLKKEVFKEVEILRLLQHVCVVSFIGVTINPTTDELMMVMEYLEDGSLDDLLRSSNHLSRGELLQIALDVAEGLCYLHSQRIIHRDLKSANVLLYNNKTRAKITDFGTARILSNSSKASTVTGTFGFMAPEILSETRYDAKADVYSFGVLVFQMLTRKALPVIYHNSKCEEIVKTAVNDATLHDFIINCCKMDPSERLTIDECITTLKEMIAVETSVNAFLQEWELSPELLNTYLTEELGSEQPNIEYSDLQST